jgi:hypothetical protein
MPQNLKFFNVCRKENLRILCGKRQSGGNTKYHIFRFKILHNRLELQNSTSLDKEFYIYFNSKLYKLLHICIFVQSKMSTFFFKKIIKITIQVSNSISILEISHLSLIWLNIDFIYYIRNI